MFPLLTYKYTSVLHIWKYFMSQWEKEKSQQVTVWKGRNEQFLREKYWQLTSEQTVSLAGVKIHKMG